MVGSMGVCGCGKRMEHVEGGGGWEDVRGRDRGCAGGRRVCVYEQLLHETAPDETR